MKYKLPVVLLCSLIITLPGSAIAQIIKVDTVTHWKKSFKVGANLNQATFSSNWKAGGSSSIGYNALLNYKVNYKFAKHSWDSEIDLLYGNVNNSGVGPRKTMDRIFLDTKYGRVLSKHWNAILSANLSTQFAPGNKYTTDSLGYQETTPISDFFAPAFITAALGFEYKPADYFSLRLSPLAPRVTIVENIEKFVTVDNPRPYGVTPPNTTRFEWFAFQLLAEFNKDLAPNVNLKWRYVMFANYETLEAKKVDHRVDLTLVAKVNKFVNCSIGGIFLYDYDQDTKVQLSESLSLGVLYTIQNYEDKK